MSGQGVVRVLLLVALFCWANRAATSVLKASGQVRPNVILCMTDDQGWGDTAYNGHPHLQTPNLDRMASEGVCFQRFYAAAPVCSPTRGSCLTGRHPARYGIDTANSGRILPDEITLAEMLKPLGYTTAHFGKWHLGTLTTKINDSNRGRPGNMQDFSPPWMNGFDECFSTEAKVPTWNPMLVPATGHGHTAGTKGRFAGAPYGTHYWLGPERIATGNLAGDDSRVIMDRVIPCIRRSVANERPFFIVIWFHAPHLPAIAGGKYLETYKHFPTDKQHYFGCLSAMDEQLGRLRGELQRLGVSDDTLLWFCSDNGPEGLERAPGSTKGLRGRKRSLYEGGIRVPGLLVWPRRIREARTVEAPATTSDFVPTILAALGSEHDQQLQRPCDGIDLLPLIDGKRALRGRPIAFAFGKQECVIGDRYKLYRKTPNDEFELYDVTSNPMEKVDLARAMPGKVKELRKLLQTWRQSCQSSAAGGDYTTGASRASKAG